MRSPLFERFIERQVRPGLRGRERRALPKPRDVWAAFCLLDLWGSEAEEEKEEEEEEEDVEEAAEEEDEKGEGMEEVEEEEEEEYWFELPVPSGVRS